MSHLLYVLSLIVFASAAFIGGAMWNDNFDRKFRITLLESYINCREKNK